MTNYDKSARATLILVFLCLLASAASPSSHDFSFPSVEEAIDRAKRELSGEGDSMPAKKFQACESSGKAPMPSNAWAAVIVKYTYSDDTKKSAEMRINAHSRNRGRRLPPDTARIYFVYVDKQRVQFTLSQHGYHTIKQTFDVAEGEIRVIDDLVLERVTKDYSAKLVGRVWLEGEGDLENDDLENISVHAGQSRTKTDKWGRFELHSIPSGKVYLIAKKDGYVFATRKINVRGASRRVVLREPLKGYLNRGVLVRWAYQRNGTRNLSDELEGGISLLGGGHWTRISFEPGFALEKNRYDFEMKQAADQLRITPTSGSKGTELIRLPDMTLGEVQQAPHAQYSQASTEIREGDVLIFAIQGGQYFGAFEVLEITVGARERERVLGDLARQPLE